MLLFLAGHQCIIGTAVAVRTDYDWNDLNVCVMYNAHCSMKSMKSRRRSKIKTRNRSTRTRRRSRKFAFDPACWGKNKPLEQLWRDLTSFLSVIVIYKGSRPYEIVMLNPQPQSYAQLYAQLRTYDDDPQVIAILSAHPEIKHAYETLVYPKVKDKTVDYVITNYAKIFKRMRANAHVADQPIKKLMVPY